MAEVSETSLAAVRHTLAHLLAAAVLQHYPHAKPTIGPPIEHGFYYDFDFGDGPKPGLQDLPRLTETMRSLLPQWKEWKRTVVSAAEARERFAGNPYKQELIDELEREGATITLYTCGGFTDLCRGGHTPHPAQDIDPESFTLDRIAGAYWRGDERNPMLTRIYGLAFSSKEQLEEFLRQREEAKQRDHRKLGRELDLFTFSDLVGSGLPLWTPRGTTVRTLLDQYVWQLRKRYGYQCVTIPHLTRRALYETSGHWEKFADELFTITSREGKEYAVKPMNCPHHTQLFARRPHSYREMPQRYAETTMVYRDEQSGELGGLTRVLSITQDDSHVFCRVNQIRDEFFAIWDIIDTFYHTFHFTLRVRLSFHDPNHPEKYLGSPEVWRRAEEALRSIAAERGAAYFEAPGEAAMYGPKLDFLAKDSLGRIHCAVMGSLERFIAVLLEHTGGHLPFWLAPEQVRLLPVGEAHRAQAQAIARRLEQEGIRSSLAEPDTSIGKRVREAVAQKIPIRAVVGDREVAEGTLTLTHLPSGATVTLPLEEAIRRLSRANALGASDIILT